MSTSTISSYSAFIGIDWASQKHDFFIQAKNTAEHRVINADPVDLKSFFDEVTERFPGHLAIAVECRKGPIINFLANLDNITIYEINPLSFSQYRKAFRLSSAKDDKSDCRLLCEILYKNLDHFRALDFSDKSTRLIGELNEKRRRCIEDRTKITNRLRELLKKFFPQALTEKLIGEFIYCQMAIDFLRKWPSLQALQRSKNETISIFYRQHQCKRKNVIEKRLKAIRTAVPLSTDADLIDVYGIELSSLLLQLEATNKAIALYNQKINDFVDEDVDAPIFLSVPGIAKTMAARMIQAFGKDRTRYANVEEFMNTVGISPVTIQSGKSMIIRRRYAKPTFIHQSFVEFAGYAAQNCPWSKAFADAQRFKGSKGYKIRRALAFKWVRILFSCWKNKSLYNGDLYLKRIQKKNSPYGFFVVGEKK